jgi:riboflavin kinase/FMN adenylyltransferase
MRELSSVLWHGSGVATWTDRGGAGTARITGGTAVTIGTFDGVHRGHQALLARTREVAGDLPVVAVTFDPHPVAVFAPERVPARLTSLERRVALLREPAPGVRGADHVRVLDFTREMAAWSPREFVERVVVEELGARHVVVGENFTFGSKAAGTTETLRTLCAEHGCDAGTLTLVGEGEVWSSTRVRRLVADARLREAAEVLGRPHEVDGVVTPGDQRGRDLGFPTANVPVDASCSVPPDGVYAGRLVTDGTTYPAAISIGTNPTFAGTERRVESYVMDHGHELDLYGRHVRVELVEHLRGMVAYEGVDALVEQMHTDVADARTALGRP